MKSLFATTLAFCVLTSSVHAGGPVILEEEGNPEVIAEAPTSTIGLLPLLIIPVVLCLALCGGGDDDPEEPPKVPQGDG